MSEGRGIKDVKYALVVESGNKKIRTSMVLRPFHILNEEEESVSAVELPVTEKAKIHILEKNEVRDRPRFQIGQQAMFCGTSKYDLSLGHITGPPSTLLNKRTGEQKWLFQVREEERGPDGTLRMRERLQDSEILPCYNRGTVIVCDYDSETLPGVIQCCSYAGASVKVYVDLLCWDADTSSMVWIKTGVLGAAIIMQVCSPCLLLRFLHNVRECARFRLYPRNCSNHACLQQ